MWLFSLGPAPTLMGKPLMYRGPYALLMFLPGFNALRVPARFWMTVTLCLAVVGAIVFDRLTEKLGRDAACGSRDRVARRARRHVDVGDAARRDAEAVRGVELLAHRPNGPIVELPLGDTYGDVAAMYRQMTHGRPLVNGYSGYFPPHYAALRFGLALRDHDVLTQLAAHGVTDVIVDRETTPAAAGTGTSRRIRRPGLCARKGSRASIA